MVTICTAGTGSVPVPLTIATETLFFARDSINHSHITGERGLWQRGHSPSHPRESRVLQRSAAIAASVVEMFDTGAGCVFTKSENAIFSHVAPPWDFKRRRKPSVLTVEEIVPSKPRSEARSMA